MAYERLNLGYGDLLDADVFKHIEDGIEALDLALDSKVIDVEKMHYGTNRFDKNKHAFVKHFYQDANIGSDLKFTKYTNVNACFGGGWYDIPVTPGKTYTIAINNPVTITDYGDHDITYGVFTGLFFVDNTGTLINHACFRANYYSKVGGVSGHESLQTIKYNTKKIICESYENPSDSNKGFGTSKIRFTVLDESINKVHIQIGSWDVANDTSAKYYQINAGFSNNRYLTDAEIQQIQDSFQINEGDVLLEYEEFSDHVYIEKVTESNLTKIQSAFTLIPIPSSNLFDPVNHIVNHSTISGTTLSYEIEGAPLITTYGRSCLIKIPVETKSYVLHLNEKMTIGNKEFCTFGRYLFLDENDVIVCGTYPITVKDTGYSPKEDRTKASLDGVGTETLTFTIYDPTIKYLVLPVLDSDKQVNGLWLNYENTGGLTNDEALELFSKIQLNDQGYTILPYESFYDVKYKSVLSPEYIQGLDTFMEDTNAKIEEAVANIKVGDGSKMSCVIQENDFYIRAKQFEDDKDAVWHLQKVNSTGGNKYFNISNLYTCNKNTKEEVLTDALTLWKWCGDDIAPPVIKGTYIAANHGAACLDKITHTAHGKTTADIGSVYLDSSTNKTYVLTTIYNENTLGLVYFSDSIMKTGVMTYGNPSVGTTLICQSNATNTNNIVIESREANQLFPCFNHYTIKFFVDGIEKDLNEQTILEGDRFEVVTQYDVMYVPAMLEYLMENIGNVDINFEEVEQSYMTMYITYQFNKNGSISTYSSFYMPMDINVGYIGLTQSYRVSETPYTYVPDTTVYQIPVLHKLNADAEFLKNTWVSQEKVPYRYYQFADDTFGKGVVQTYDRTIGWGKNDIRLNHISHAGRFSAAAKMYTAFISGCNIPAGTYFDGMAARIPLYKYDPDLTSVCWYWCSDDIILMIDTHNSVNKDIVLPDYMNNMRIEVLDKTDSMNFNQTYVFNNKLRVQCTDYGYLVLRLYK